MKYQCWPNGQDQKDGGVQQDSRKGTIQNVYREWGHQGWGQAEDEPKVS